MQIIQDTTGGNHATPQHKHTLHRGIHRFERKALPDTEIIRHEYINGELIAMSGASRAHNLITGNISGELRTLLKGSRCETYANEMRVSTPTTTSYFYPDVVVVCEEPRFEDDVFDTLLNPIILVEVLSPSTEVYDRREKFAHYRQLPSLQEYLLVAKIRFVLNTTVAKKNRGPHPLRGKTGFSPISKNLRKFCHSPPSNANCLCRKSMNASHFPISAGTAIKGKSKSNDNTT